MKKIASFALALMLLALVVLPLAACSKKEVLVVCNWGEYISNGSDGYMNVIKQFEKEFGVKVKYVEEESNETMYSRLTSGGGNFDVMFPSDYMAQRLIEEGLLATLDFANIPNFANIMPDFKNLAYDPANAYTVPYFWGTVGIIYNESLLSAKDLSSMKNCKDWSILWSKDYPNQIMMFNNPRDAFSIAENQLGFSMNTEDPDELRTAADLLKEQKFIYTMDEIFERMPGGSLALGVYYAGDYLTMASENEDLKFVIPQSGTNIFNDVMCVPAASKNKALAEKFINFMLRADVGKANTEYLGYSTPNQLVYNSLDEELKQSKIAYPERKDSWEAFHNLSKEATEQMASLFVEVKRENNNKGK